MALTYAPIRRMTGPAVRQRYVSETVETVSPERLVTMLYDALVSDLEHAEQTVGDREATHRHLTHAQAVVYELRAGLKPELWSGGPALSALYAYFVEQLIYANINQDGAKITEIRQMVEPLRDAWHQAAAQLRAAS
jgi:flagellar secretion chaperone FliS